MTTMVRCGKEDDYNGVAGTMVRRGQWCGGDDDDGAVRTIVRRVRG